MNNLARNVYALTQNQSLLEMDTLTTPERTAFSQLVDFRHTLTTDASVQWNAMAQGWYPATEDLESSSSKPE